MEELVCASCHLHLVSHNLSRLLLVVSLSVLEGIIPSKWGQYMSLACSRMPYLLCYTPLKVMFLNWHSSIPIAWLVAKPFLIVALFPSFNYLASLKRFFPYPRWSSSSVDKFTLLKSWCRQLSSSNARGGMWNAVECGSASLFKEGALSLHSYSSASPPSDNLVLHPLSCRHTKLRNKRTKEIRLLKARKAYSMEK